MLNYLWGAMLLLGIVYGAFHGRLPEITTAALDSAKEAVTLCITMTGVMSLWVGLMEIAQKSGIISRAAAEKPGCQPKILNLFAYTGGATVAAAKAGAAVTHVDASKGMVTWAKENAAASGLGGAPIRYIVDDCTKFVERELRRGSR